MRNPSQSCCTSKPGYNKLRDMAAKSNEIYIFELLAALATVSQLRCGLWGRLVILSAGNEAACAALTKGARKDAIASMLLLTLRAIAPQNDVAFCTGRVPSRSTRLALRPETKRYRSLLGFNKS